MATKDEDAVTELFVTSTHTPVLFFSNKGQVYRLKVWKLPEGGPQTRGRPMVNLLPLSEGEVITNVLPLPEDEGEWGNLHIVFATARGMVRRNSMDAFTNVPSNGKIAMRFDDESDDRLIGVRLLTEEHDVFLASRQGKAIRFAATDVREFQSRTATGVRGMNLADDDEVVSMATLRTDDTTSEERDAYLRAAPWKENEAESTLAADRMDHLHETEEFIMTVCANGYGKISSAYDYRQIGRGGKGLINIDNIGRNGPVVASFPVVTGQQLMLVTDQAKMIRLGLNNMRVIGRNSAGVLLFDVAKGEHVVGAARIDEDENPENEAEAAIAEELAEGDPKAVQLDDGTSRETLSENVEEEDPDAE